MKKGIIFDLDGTLWDVTDTTWTAANEIANKYGFPPITKETIMNGFGKDKESNAKLYFPTVELDKAINLLSETSILKNEILSKTGGIIYNNLKSTLDKLKDTYDFFIVSYTSDRKYIEIFLESSGLSEYFTDYIASGELNMKKYEAIKEVINRNNLKESVYVGDTIIDRDESNLAGVPFIHARYGFDKELNSKYSIDKIDDLVSILENIFKTNLN